MAHAFLGVPPCTKISSLLEDIMVHYTRQSYVGPLAHNRYVRGWPNTDCYSQTIGINQGQVSRLIAKYRQTNDVTDRPMHWRPRLSSATNDRVRARSAVRDPKAPCSELRQQWQNLHVQASIRTVNRRLGKAGLKARRRTFLTLDHRRNCVPRNLGKWRRIYWSEESRFLVRFTDGRVRVWRRRGQDQFQDNVVAETEIIGGGSILV